MRPCLFNYLGNEKSSDILEDHINFTELADAVPDEKENFYSLLSIGTNAWEDLSTDPDTLKSMYSDYFKSLTNNSRLFSNPASSSGLRSYIDGMTNLTIENITGTRLASMFVNTVDAVGRDIKAKPSFNKNESYYVITGVDSRSGELKLLFSLSAASKNTALTGVLNTHFRKMGVSSMPLSNSALSSFLTKLEVAPPALNKGNGSNASKVQTLGELKDNLGSNFKYMFSSPFIVTDTGHPRFKAHRGKSILFYSKYPDGRTTVDSLVNAGNYNEGQLGFLVLDEKAPATSLVGLRNNLMKIISTLDENMDKTDLRILIGPKIVNAFGRTFPGSFVRADAPLMTETFAQRTYDAMQSRFVEILRRSTDDEIIKLEQEMLEKNPQAFADGYYISPSLISSKAMTSAPFARMLNNKYIEDLINENLVIQGLGPMPLIPHTLRMDTCKSSAMLDLLEVDSQKSDAKPYIAYQNPVSVVQQDLSGISKFKTASYERFAQKMAEFGIDLADTSNVMRDVIMDSATSGLNFNESLQNFLNTYGLCD